MSKNSINHDNSTEAAAKFLAVLVETGLVRSVWLGASRSPKSAKNVHENSDWDFQLIGLTATELERLPNPAELGVYVDLHARKQPSKYAVEIYPTDVYGVMKT